MKSLNQPELFVFRGIGQLRSFQDFAKGLGRCPRAEGLKGEKASCLVVSSQGRILWMGPEKKLSKTLFEELVPEVQKKSRKKKTPSVVIEEIHLGGQQVYPGFVECHTHSVFAGNRQAEFELRNQGVTYQEIAARGGGILSTVQATRKASEGELLRLTQSRVRKFLEQGVTTLETKSGYGLSSASELKILKIHQRLKGPRIVSTFLGAHAKPPEFATYRDYLDMLTHLLPKVWKLGARRVDAFVEKGFFEPLALRSYLQAAKKQGFEITLHADQLSLSGGSELGLEFGALSCDHVICLDERLIKRVAESSTTAVCLPGADFYLKCSYPPARKLIDQGGRVALATDFNPGSSPTQDLSLIGVLARLEMKMSLAEVFCSYSYSAAAALGLQDQVGSLEVGKFADFFVSEADPEDFFYQVGQHPLNDVYRAGQRLSV